MEIQSNSIDYKSLSKSFVISVVSALCAYLLVFIYTNFAPLYFAYDFDIPAFVNLRGINFQTIIDADAISRDALVTILLSKPIAAVIVGIISLIILMIGTKKPISIILVLFWLNIFAFDTAFGILIDDAVAHSGTYEVAMAMNIHNVLLVAISILLAFILFKIGMMNARLIIMSFPHQDLCNTRPRIIFFIAIFLIPLFLVLVYTFLTGGQTESTSELMKNLPVLILLIPFLTASKPENTDFKYLPTVRHSYIDIILLILFILISVIVIMTMYNGLIISG